MKTFWKIVFATLFAVGVDYYLSAFGEERSIAYNFIDIFVFFSALLAFKQVPKVPKRKLMIGANTFALLLSLALVIGKAVYDTNSISLLIAGVPQITITLISLTGFTVVISAVTYILFAALAKNESKLDAKLWKFFAHPKAFLMIWAVILSVGYLVFWLIIRGYGLMILKLKLAWQVVFILGSIHQSILCFGT